MRVVRYLYGSWDRTLKGLKQMTDFQMWIKVNCWDRTLKGLKLVHRGSVKTGERGWDRTLKGLKPVSATKSSRHLELLGSYLEGIETRLLGDARGGRLCGLGSYLEGIETRLLGDARGGRLCGLGSYLEGIETRNLKEWGAREKEVGIVP